MVKKHRNERGRPPSHLLKKFRGDNTSRIGRVGRAVRKASGRAGCPIAGSSVAQKGSGLSTDVDCMSMAAIDAVGAMLGGGASLVFSISGKLKKSSISIAMDCCSWVL